MKLKTVLISTVVSAALVAGVGYGAYYAMQGQQVAIEVVPVANVNTGYWGDTDTFYGVVTSQAAQNVMLDENYTIADIYVEAGDHVKEGTPLFSYDMTLQELELELEQLSLHTKELNKAKLEKELEKLKKTPATASLSSNDSSLTTAAEDEIIAETPAGQDSAEKETGSGGSESGGSAEEVGDGEIKIDDIEPTTDPGLTQEQETTEKDRVTQFVLDVRALEALFLGEELKVDEAGTYIRDTVEYYRHNLAEEHVEEQTAEDGKTVKVRSWIVKDSVGQLLTEEERREFADAIVSMDACHRKYVELLAQEVQERLDNGVEDGLMEEASALRTEYDNLSTQLQREISLSEEVRALMESAGPETETESGESESESEKQTEPGETESESEQQTEPETEPPVDLNVYINNFVELAEKVLADGAEEQEDYVTRLGDVLVFYQEWLGEPRPEILDNPYAVPRMEEYALKKSVRDLLASEDRQHMEQQLADSYHEICLRYVQYRITTLNPQALTREAYEKAKNAYDTLGAAWQAELEQRWLENPGSQVTIAASEGTGEPQEDQTEGGEDPEGQTEDGEDTESQTENAEEGGSAGETTETVSLAQILQAYEVILQIQELDLNQEEITLMAALEKARDAYLALTEGQKQLVWNADVLIELLQKYGLWITDELPEDPSGGFDDFGDMGDDGMSYTAEELKAMIEDKEREIKDCDLDIRSSELEVKKKQRIVEGKVVKSTLEGTVISIGTKDGSSEDDYFAKVAGEVGLYARGALNELDLGKVKVGDTISGRSWDNSMSFTAVVKEISSYPTTDGGMSYGSENTNSSYYPFYALIEDTEGVEEGDVELQLSASMESGGDGIYLENFFVRTGSDGKSYVYMQGEDKKLKKQYVTTGRRVGNYAIEIVSGLETTDRIAFPYGKGVKEGAETKDVDNLKAAYM